METDVQALDRGSRIRAPPCDRLPSISAVRGLMAGRLISAYSRSFISDVPLLLWAMTTPNPDEDFTTASDLNENEAMEGVCSHSHL